MQKYLQVCPKEEDEGGGGGGGSDTSLSYFSKKHNGSTCAFLLSQKFGAEHLEEPRR